MVRRLSSLRLAAFLGPTGYHVAAWRHPDVPADAGINFPHYRELARLAERGTFDFVFLADSPAVRGWDDLPAMARTAIRYLAQFEPLTLLSALAVATDRIGLVASATTTFNEPYHVARMFASLDHISGGRAGWNVVTSQNPDEAPNFGADALPSHAARYARAREFVDVVTGLWDTWDDDAFVRDKASGAFFEVERLHLLDHTGPHFRVRGPLNIPRAPQGHPVVVQAGSSADGRALAGEVAEVVFTAHDQMADAQAFYAEMKTRAEATGRRADDILVLPGIFPFVGRTRQEADDKAAELQALIDPMVGLSLLSNAVGFDLTGLPLDQPLPRLPESDFGRSRQQLLAGIAHRERLTIRQLCMHIAGPRGHLRVTGTARQVADEMEAWFEGGAADGFVLMPPSLPGGLRDFVELVVPELRRRGLFRSEYEGRTLREHLGLPRPSHRSRRSVEV